MLETKTSLIHMRVLVVDDELGSATAEGRAIRTLTDDLRKRGVDVVEAVSAEDGTSVVTSDSAIHAVLIDWNLGEDEDHERARGFIGFLRSRNDKIPIFLMAERRQGSAVSV